LENGNERPGDGENLENGGDLAGISGLQRGLMICHGEDPEAEGNEDISTHDDYRQPTRDDAENSQGDEGRSQEEFVGDGIQIGAQLRALMPDFGDETIETIGYPRDDEGNEGILERFRDQKDDKDGDEEYPDEGQCVGKAHGLDLSFLLQYQRVKKMRMCWVWAVPAYSSGYSSPR